MNPEELWQTTLNPEKRTLLQVNIQIIQKLNQKKIKIYSKFLWVMKWLQEKIL